MERSMRVICEKSDARHRQAPDIRANGPQVHSKTEGAPKAAPSPGSVGIIDGEREPLPE